jgi:hypothetical protein
MENHFEWMTYMQHNWAMCWDLKFLNNTEINDCHCPDVVKRSCLALRDMFKSNNPNKGYMIVKFIELTKEHIRESLSK